MRSTWLENMVAFAVFAVFSITALIIGYLFSVTFFQIIGVLIALSLANMIHSLHSDRKTFADLQNHLIIAPKDNPAVNMIGIMGYGGGALTFADEKEFAFYTNDYLYPASNLISSSPSFKIVSSVWV